MFFGSDNTGPAHPAIMQAVRERGMVRKLCDLAVPWSLARMATTPNRNGGSTEPN